MLHFYNIIITQSKEVRMINYWNQFDREEIEEIQEMENYEIEEMEYGYYESERESEKEEDYDCSRCCGAGCNYCLMLQY